MAAVLDRVVPSRRKERDRLRHLGDSHDSRFGDVTISAPHQGGWSHPGVITKLRNEWDADDGQSPVDKTMTPTERPNKDYDQIIIVDDTQSFQGAIHHESANDKNAIIFPPPLPSFTAKRSHSRNGSLAGENIARTNSPAHSVSGVGYKPVHDTYMQEYARMSPDGSKIGPWSYAHEAYNREPEIGRGTTPTDWSHSSSNSPPPLTHSASDVTTPASIEFTRSNAGSPSMSMLSPVSEDFAKDDPRHREMASMGMTPLPSRTPQPAYSKSPPTSDSEDYPWASLPPAPLLQQLSSDEERPRPRSRARSVSRRTDSGFFPRSRSVDFPDQGRATPPMRNLQFANGRRDPSTDVNSFAANPFSGPSWDPSIRSRSPHISRPGTADSFRSNTPSQTSHSNIYSFDKATTVNIFHGDNLEMDNMMTPAEYEKLYNERMRARSALASRARAPSAGPVTDRTNDRDPTPVPRGRVRSRSASRNPPETTDSDPNTERCRSASRGSVLRNYMTFDDMGPEEIPLPASRPGSRPPSRPASRAASRVRDRAPSRVARRDLSRGRDAFGQASYATFEEEADPHAIPLPPSRPGSRAPSVARDRAVSRTGRRETSRPRATSRNPQPRAGDANGYYDASDADVNTSSGEDWPPPPPLPPSRPQSRRPSVSIGAGTMSSSTGRSSSRPGGGGTNSDGGGVFGPNGFPSRENFKAEVAREAEFLLRTMRGEGTTTDEDSDMWSARNSGTDSLFSNGTARTGSDKAGEATGGKKKSQLVPDDESLWG